MVLIYNPASPVFQGQNIRPPLGSLFNGQAYKLGLYPELGREDRSVLVIKMVLQFQFEDTKEGSWSGPEKSTFAKNFVNSVKSVWNERFRIKTTSRIPRMDLRDVGVVFEFPYFIDGYHLSDDFELSVKKIKAGGFSVSRCRYSLGNTYLDSEDAVAINKGASMRQRGTVHEFGHMLGLRDEYAAAKSNLHYTGDTDSVMNAGELVRTRHYAPFAGWLTQQFRFHSRILGKPVEYKVAGTTDLTNALL